MKEEAIVVTFRRHTLLTLDDCLYALQPTNPAPDAILAAPLPAAGTNLRCTGLAIPRICHENSTLGVSAPMRSAAARVNAPLSTGVQNQ